MRLGILLSRNALWQSRSLPMFAIVMAVAALSVASPAVAAVECDADALCPSSPCTITGTHHLGYECFLDFGDKDVTIAPGALLIWPGDFFGPNVCGLGARNLTVAGTLSFGVGSILQLTTQEDFQTTQRPGEGLISIYGRNLSAGGSGVNIDAGGNVVLAGSRISARGVSINAASIEVDQQITAMEVEHEIQAPIYLCALSGPIRVTQRLAAGSAIFDSGGQIMLQSPGDVSVEAPIWLTSGAQVGDALNLDIEAGGNVTLDRVTMNSFQDGGSLTVDANGDITMLGTVSVRGNAPNAGGGVMLFFGGILRVAGKIDVSCQGDRNQCFGGDITIFPGCYSDLTGAKFVATPAGFIEGCSCIHGPGDVCDGGCAGLDQARINPSLGPLPMCSP
jgi:hypothetical protein